MDLNKLRRFLSHRQPIISITLEYLSSFANSRFRKTGFSGAGTCHESDSMQRIVKYIPPRLDREQWPSGEKQEYYKKAHDSKTSLASPDELHVSVPPKSTQSVLHLSVWLYLLSFFQKILDRNALQY